MTVRRKKNAPGRTVSMWTAFDQVYPVSTVDDKPLEEVAGETYWRNSFYLVMRKALEPDKDLEGAVLLTIKQSHGKAIRDWKHFQRIKNELVDPEREAVEIFPPESMVTDISNEHHLFVTPVGVSSIYVFEEKMRQSGDENIYDTLRSAKSDE